MMRANAGRVQAFKNCKFATRDEAYDWIKVIHIKHNPRVEYVGGKLPWVITVIIAF